MTYPHQLSWLSEHAATRPLIAEIGCFRGESTVALASTCPGTVYAVDPWLPWDDLSDSANYEYRLASNANDQIFQDFLAKTKPYANIKPVRMSSEEAFGLFSLRFPDVDRLSFDMIYIDADHRYEHALWDITHWKTLLKPGGLLAGHDFDLCGVNQAVKEALPNCNIEQFPNAIWWEIINP
jgi:SAM-dependent methyltransferase